MKNTIIALLSLLPFIINPSQALAYSFVNNPRTQCLVQTQDYNGLVNVRYYPTIHSRIIAIYPNQTPLVPVAKVYNEGYIWVAIYTQSTIGFVRGDYLSNFCFDVPWIN